MEFVRPRVVVSRSSGFAACRDHAQGVNDDFVAQLAPHVEHVAAWPEDESAPGAPLEHGFSCEFLDRLGGIDGFILSAGGVLARFAEAAVEDEDRLRNRDVREHFLTKLYALARLRVLATAPGAAGLVAFHSRYKYLLMACSPVQLRALGRIVAAAGGEPAAAAVAAYRSAFARTLARAPQPGAHVNTLMHIVGYVSDRLSAAEKALFRDVLQEYRAGRVPLATALTLLRGWVLRFDLPYLAAQAYFEPYPRELASLVDPAAR